ncbi:pyridoxal phosphate-dependent transferase [Thelonectria olida]|uniref:Molybdenum cofactor sulfurase n=1 Tax=Thelonectria olida TaxID=1576542 RepID=A0A9P8W829_9HYPO|nr:pyridoxal phosphate-dependent transferase [Thelonectria olida]
MTTGGARAYNDRIESFRDDEYPMLRDQIYLDHAATTLYAKSLLEKFTADMTASLYGNPHSASPSSNFSTTRIEQVRERVLRFFNADPSKFDVVFVANATAGVKLVSEALRACPDGFDYLYHQACHTSLVGVRQEASDSLCVDDKAIQNWMGDSTLLNGIGTRRTTLFAYPAQSNMDGRRFPLDWSHKMRSRHTSSSNRCYTLLDAAAYVATSPLDLSHAESAPDFTVLSFYKIFGFPHCGALIVRRKAASVFQHRKYFGGGTVDMVLCGREQWHARKSQSLHASLEDGTLPIDSIIALGAAFDVHKRLFGSMVDISKHTTYLTQRLRAGLASLRHGNGERVCVLYSPKENDVDASLGMGPVIAFNLRMCSGSWVSLTEFDKLASVRGFHTRTGGLCNPGGVAAALELEPWEMKKNFSAGFRCGDENDIRNGKPTGVIRVSLGALSTVKDVDMFLAFVSEFYQTSQASDMHVEDIVVYPIKSCGGFHVPKGQRWEVKPEGLAWDREWCLIHSASGQVLSQKRYPLMALLRPHINLETGMLVVTFQGWPPSNVEASISIPLSEEEALLHPTVTMKNTPSRVCGQEISAQRYVCTDMNDFFSNILGVQCVLARFPAGGDGKSMRYAKAHKKHRSDHAPKREAVNCVKTPATPHGLNPEAKRRKILLSNESPMLLINSASLSALNREIVTRGGKPASPDVFRANIVVGSKNRTSESLPYSEDFWDRLRIGGQEFETMGSCQRCHMVCINQQTATKSNEPFVTLSRTRRFDGKVFFGTHTLGIAIGDAVQAINEI